MVHMSFAAKSGMKQGCHLPAASLQRIPAPACQENLRYRKIWRVPCGPGAASQGRREGVGVCVLRLGLRAGRAQERAAGAQVLRQPLGACVCVRAEQHGRLVTLHHTFAGPLTCCCV